MTEYLLINTLISIWALSIYQLTNIDIRTKFYSLVAAMVCWIIPFGLFTFQSSLIIVEHTAPILAKVKTPVVTMLEQTKQVPSGKQILMTLIIVGLLRFLFDLIQLKKQHFRLVSQATATNINNVFTIKGLNNACVTGLWSPKIWVDEDMFNSEYGKSIVNHERQHIQSGDPYWLLLIALFRCLFWFNPIIWILSKKLQLTIELRCDAACQKLNPNGEYQVHLAKILLKLNQQDTYTINHMSLSQKDDILRIKQLSKESQMTKNNKWLFPISLISIMLVSINVLADSTHTKLPSLSKDQVFFEIAFSVAEAEKNTELEKEKFSVLTTDNQITTVKVNAIQIEIKPHIIRKENESTQILSELVVTDTLSEKILARPSLLIFNNQNAAVVINKGQGSQSITLELKPITH